MKFAIVGCGVVGHKRAHALGSRLVACADQLIARAQALAADFPNCTPTTEVRRAIEAADVVVVATTHDALVETALAAIEAGKHVLVEKPAARSAAELEPVIGAALRHGVVAKAGFNHRFHPSLQQARLLFDQGAIGPLMYLRGRYGHGGRPGYEREWRAQPRVSGGGELLDQGSHLIDLARWFAGDFPVVMGDVGSYFWPMPVEDNAFALLKTATGEAAWLHASWTEWKNLFSFEIFGRMGKLQIEGLGGSYGIERLTLYRMLPEMGPPETTCWEFRGADQSWQEELEHLSACIRFEATLCGSLQDAHANLEIIHRIYQQAGRDYYP